MIRPCGRRGCAKGMKGRRREVVKVGNYRGRCWFMMLNNNLFVSGRVFIKVTIALAMFLGRDNVLLSFMSLSALLCEKSSCSVSRWTRNTVDQMLIEVDAMYAKTFEQQSIPDTETLPLTYLPNRAVWPSTRPNQSPIESNNVTNQSPIVGEANQSNKVLFETQTNYQSFVKTLSIECKLQNAECRPGIKCRLSIKCRLCVQTRYKLIKCRLNKKCAKG